MAPKKATTGAASAPKAKKPATGDAHQSTKEMIKEAIITLKERNGSSRQAIKKYIISNKGITDDKTFTSQLNRALRTGVEKGEFAQPKGPSGPVKLAHKEATKKASPPKETAAKKEVKPKTETKKKSAPAATPATKKASAKPTAAKKASVPKKASAPKPKATANSSSKRKSAPTTSAPAVVDKPTTLTKTKSGRVAKTTATPSAKKPSAKKASAKKPSAKAPSTKKESAKAEAAA